MSHNKSRLYVFGLIPMRIIALVAACHFCLWARAAPEKSQPPDENRFSDQEIGIEITQPKDWTFVHPASDSSDSVPVVEIHKASAGKEFHAVFRIQRLLDVAQGSLVEALKQRHAKPDLVVPPQEMRFKGRKAAYAEIWFYIVTSVGPVRPTNQITTTTTVEVKEMRTIAKTWLIQHHDSFLLVSMNDPDGDGSVDKEFKGILDSLKLGAPASSENTKPHVVLKHMSPPSTFGNEESWSYELANPKGGIFTLQLWMQTDSNAVANLPPGSERVVFRALMKGKRHGTISIGGQYDSRLASDQFKVGYVVRDGDEIRKDDFIQKVDARFNTLEVHRKPIDQLLLNRPVTLAEFRFHNKRGSWEDPDPADKKSTTFFLNAQLADTKDLVGLQKKAEQGSRDARLELGLLFFRGDGVRQDHQVAAKWLRPPAEAGNVEAQYALGVAHESQGRLEAAGKWYELAAKQKHKDAEARLARMKLEGAGLKQDVEGALKWYLAAAMAGDSGAQLELGTIYSDGRWVPKNLPEAYAWFSITRSGFVGSLGPGAMARDLEAKMTLKEVAEGKKRLAQLRRELGEVEKPSEH
ncbi:MAG: sel1 repeat family protein [Verrucomicrobia bacterium]|nr:sel1 repeat family protein [Verrucomicrobiota bacterium]